LAKITLQQAIEILNLISKANFTEETVQKILIERFDLMEALMRHPEAVKTMDSSLFEAFILGNSPSSELLETFQATDEEGVISEYGYPAGWKLKTVKEQLAILDGFFPDLTFEATIPDSLPDGAEGWLLVPKPSSIAKNYNEATEKLLSLMAEARTTFFSSREGKLGGNYLRLLEKTRRVLDDLERSTPGDYLVLAIQCGRQYRAKPVSQARNTFEGREYGLGPLEIASLLLTHPERLTDYEHLGIDCPGCEYAPDARGDFHYTLSFAWSEDGLYFDCGSADGVAPGFGSASGFLSSQSYE